MARRKINPTDSIYSGPSWQRFYPDVYARGTASWQTRTGRRNREFATFANMLGLNTAFDDIHKRDGESPYLRNVRYMGDKQEVQRAQVTSRSGAKLLGVKDYRVVEAWEPQYFIELWEGRAIEIDLDPRDNEATRDGKGLLIGGAIEVRNIEGAKGRLRVILKRASDQREICDANIPLDCLDAGRWHKRPFFFINPLPIKDGLTLRFEIEGDVEPDACGDYADGRKIRIRSNGGSTHRSANYTRPNTNECMREVPYEWTVEPATVCWDWFINSEAPMLKGTQVCTPDGNFLVFPLRNDEGITLWRFNTDTHEYTEIDTTNSPIDERSVSVRFAQGLGKLYFVDGYSPLQRVDLSSWKGELAIADPNEIDVEGTLPEDLQAQPGASLIFRIRNRIILAGFADDPNFVQYSILNSLTGTPDNPAKNGGVQYDQFSDISWFYSPDKSPKDSTCGPVTALEQFENNLIIFRTNGSSVYQMGSEFSAPSQEDMFSYNIGVERQEDVTNANGNLYIYNRSEGLRRFSGAEATFQSMQIDNELRKIPVDSPRFMLAHANKVRFYCDLAGRGYADHNFIYHQVLAQQSPWYCDDNTPVCWAIGDQNSDTIYAMHAGYPAIFIVDAVDQYTDFDSSIQMAYDTQYKSPGELVGWTILRRVFLRLVASSTNAWFIGVDFNHEDRPAVWRKYVKEQVDEPVVPEGVFDNTADAGTHTINLMMRAQCRDFQVRVRVSCWRDNALLQMIIGEYGGRPGF